MFMLKLLKSFCLIFTYSLLFSGCLNRHSKCPIEALVLDKSLFPEGAHIGPLRLHDPEMPKESAYRNYSYDSYVIFIDVANWNSTRNAKSKFKNEINAAFDVDKYMGPWEVPKDLYTISNADDYGVACGTAHGSKQCRLLATYKEYLVYMKFDASTQYVPIAKFNELLKAIDERMLECTSR